MLLDLKANQDPQAQRVPEESEDHKGTLVRRETRDSKGSLASQGHRVPPDSQAKLEHQVHLAPKQRRAVKGSEAPLACLALLDPQALLEFRALLVWMVWMGRMASLV